MNAHTIPQKIAAFTLIEVLLALAVISIALTAVLKAASENTVYTQRLKDKSASHWVAMQGIASIQLGLVTISENQSSTFTTEMLGQRWYWRAQTSTTQLQHVQQMNVSVSSNRDGPFSAPLLAYRYVP